MRGCALLWLSVAFLLTLLAHARKIEYRDLDLNREFEFRYSHQGLSYGSDDGPIALPRGLTIIENTLFVLTFPTTSSAQEEIHIVGFDPEGMFNGRVIVMDLRKLSFSVAASWQEEKGKAGSRKEAKATFRREEVYAAGIAADGKGILVLSLSFQRAESFFKYVMKIGVKTGQMEVVSVGEGISAPAGLAYNEERNTYLITQQELPSSESWKPGSAMLYEGEVYCEEGDVECRVRLVAAYDLQRGIMGDPETAGRVKKEMPFFSRENEQEEKETKDKKARAAQAKRRYEEVQLPIEGMTRPDSVAIHPKTRNLYVLDGTQGYLYEISPHHKLLDFWDLKKAISSPDWVLQSVQGLAVTANFIYLASAVKQRDGSGSVVGKFTFSPLALFV